MCININCYSGSSVYERSPAAQFRKLASLNLRSTCSHLLLMITSLQSRKDQILYTLNDRKKSKLDILNWLHSTVFKSTSPGIKLVYAVSLLKHKSHCSEPNIIVRGEPHNSGKSIFPLIIRARLQFISLDCWLFVRLRLFYITESLYFLLNAISVCWILISPNFLLLDHKKSNLSCNMARE